VTASPEGDKLVETIVLQFGNWTDDVVRAACWSFFDDDLNRGGNTFLISLSFEM
jgi:hypothetical protein